MWITEVNLDPNGADPGDLASYTRGGQKPAAPGLTPGDADRLKAKAILRYLVSYTNKGPVRFYFFAAKDNNPMGLGLVDCGFFQAVKAQRGAYPSDEERVTSPTMRAVRRLVHSMGTTTPESGKTETALPKPRSVLLAEIDEDHGHKQFDGDPATADVNPNPHPPLYNRDVLGFFPLQASDRKFVVAVYVMTRNLANSTSPPPQRAIQHVSICPRKATG